MVDFLIAKISTLTRFISGESGAALDMKTYSSPSSEIGSTIMSWTKTTCFSAYGRPIHLLRRVPKYLKLTGINPWRCGSSTFSLVLNVMLKDTSKYCTATSRPILLLDVTSFDMTLLISAFFGYRGATSRSCCPVHCRPRHRQSTVLMSSLVFFLWTDYNIFACTYLCSCIHFPAKRLMYKMLVTSVPSQTAQFSERMHRGSLHHLGHGPAGDTKLSMCNQRLIYLWLCPDTAATPCMQTDKQRSAAGRFSVTCLKWMPRRGYDIYMPHRSHINHRACLILP